MIGPPDKVLLSLLLYMSVPPCGMKLMKKCYKCSSLFSGIDRYSIFCLSFDHAILLGPVAPWHSDALGHNFSGRALNALGWRDITTLAAAPMSKWPWDWLRHWVSETTMPTVNLSLKSLYLYNLMLSGEISGYGWCFIYGKTYHISYCWAERCLIILLSRAVPCLAAGYRGTMSYCWAKRCLVSLLSQLGAMSHCWVPRHRVILLSQLGNMSHCWARVPCLAAGSCGIMSYCWAKRCLVSLLSQLGAMPRCWVPRHHVILLSRAVPCLAAGSRGIMSYCWAERCHVSLLGPAASCHTAEPSGALSHCWARVPCLTAGSRGTISYCWVMHHQVVW